MRTYTSILFVLVCLSVPLKAQFFETQKSTIIFFSDAPLEDIKATNTKAKALLELITLDIVFEVPIKNFEFEKDLMKQHFNEKYMETEKFPKAVLSGKLIGFDKSKNGKQQVVAVGKLVIHGVTREVEIPGTVEILSNTSLTLNARFMIKVGDYKIKIPQIVWQNIAEEVEVTVEFLLKSI